jgi:hypothetical protein
MFNFFKLLSLLVLLTICAFAEDNVLVIKNRDQRNALANIAYHALLSKGIVFELTALCESNECAIAKNAKMIYQLDFGLNGNCCTVRGEVSSNNNGLLTSLGKKTKRACTGYFSDDGVAYPPYATPTAISACDRAITKVGRMLNNY